MEILEVVKAITEYGITVVLSAIVIYTVCRLIKMQFDKLADNNSKKAHDKALELRSEIDEQVYLLIDEFMNRHEGTRIQVIEFTNTVISVAYLPFRYMSCTYEVVGYGHRPKANYIDKLSTSLFSPFLIRLGQSTHLEVTEESSKQYSGALQDLFDQIHCKRMISVMLKSSKGKCIGCVCLYKETNSTPSDAPDLITLGHELSALLGVLDK